jgi:hypothetical protein
VLVVESEKPPQVFGAQFARGAACEEFVVNQAAPLFDGIFIENNIDRGNGHVREIHFT